MLWLVLHLVCVIVWCMESGGAINLHVYAQGSQTGGEGALLSKLCCSAVLAYYSASIVTAIKLHQCSTDPSHVSNLSPGHP